jgi:hypothetical protein
MISQLITNAIGGASVDAASIGGGILLLFVGLFAGRSLEHSVSGRSRRRKPTISYLGSDGKKVSKQEFYRQQKEFYKDFDEKGYQQYLARSNAKPYDKRAYWKEPVIYDKKSGRYISREEAKYGRERIKKNKPASKPAPKGFSRSVRNISTRSPGLKIDKSRKVYDPAAVRDWQANRKPLHPDTIRAVESM